MPEHVVMMTPEPIALGAHLDEPVPRYESYPSPASFHEGVGTRLYDAWLAALPPAALLAVYVHVPFCERLCWYCSCRTQAIRHVDALDAYVSSLIAEIVRSAARLPAGARVERVIWGGGSPTSLSPELIGRLAGAVAAELPLSPHVDFTVEVDPAATSEPSLDAFAKAGITRAIVGVQDFEPAVQAAIGRFQSRAQTEAAVERLAARGVAGVEIEQLYGLPLQTPASVAAVALAVAGLAPDPVRLNGYAHVPWLAKRQRMIAEETLPGVRARLRQYVAAAAVYEETGYEVVGTDTFARPGSALAEAARKGRLRRSFDGYKAGAEDALIGFGAGAISRFAQGYVQNLAQTRAYQSAIADGGAAAGRGVAMSLEDKVRARAIEMLMCGFHIDLAAIRAEFGDFVALLEEGCAAAVARFGLHVQREGDTLRIEHDGPLVARLVARLFDARITPSAHYGMAI